VTEPLVARLLGMPLDAFRAHVWPLRAHVTPGSAERAAMVHQLVDARLLEPSAFLAAAPGLAWQHGTTEAGTYDHDTSLDTARAVARFGAGAMFDVRNLQTWNPAVAAWLAQIAEQLELGAAARASYCHAFVCPRGSGVPKHFDNREVFVVQLVGRKRWELAPNPFEYPLAAHVVGGPVHALNRHAAGLADPEMPVGETHVLEPGAVLFLPRGMWHRTHALEDSLSFSFGVRVPSRVEALVSAVAAALSEAPAWRAPAYDVHVHRPAGIELTVAAIRAAIDRLRDAVRG